MTDDDAATIAALNGRQVLALTIWAESDREPVQGQIAVANTIRHRVSAGCYGGKTYRDVCLAKRQFSCWSQDGGPENYARLMAMARLLTGPTPQPLPRTFRQAAWIADGVMAEAVVDNVNGATHYLTTDLLRSKPPGWARRLTIVAEVGRHTFLK